jgi:hypothetical protein
MQDAIDPALIEIVGGSPDVRSWKVTAAIRLVELTPAEVKFIAVGQTDWPHVTPPGWDGGIQSTLWIVVNRGGQWRATGSIEFYETRKGTGSPLSSAQADWWYYAPEIGQPQPGELVGLFIAAGDQRRKDVRSVEERSNIVTFTVPPNDTGTFTFAAVDSPVPPVDNRPPNEDGKPPRPTEYELALLQRLEQIDTVDRKVGDVAAEIGSLEQWLAEQFKKADQVVKLLRKIDRQTAPKKKGTK